MIAKGKISSRTNRIAIWKICLYTQGNYVREMGQGRNVDSEMCDLLQKEAAPCYFYPLILLTHHLHLLIRGQKAESRDSIRNHFWPSLFSAMSLKAVNVYG